MKDNHEVLIASIKSIAVDGSQAGVELPIPQGWSLQISFSHITGDSCPPVSIRIKENSLIFKPL